MSGYNETYLCDNAGNRVPPGVSSGDPIAASGIKITDATADGGDHTETVVAGATYKIMTDGTTDGAFLFGILTTATAANVIWFMPESSVLVIKIPSGVTALHYQALAGTASAYIVRLKD
ncbi:hypothetical protein LCGC14_3116200 [marine sediment metagenome]|uniref:Uncharacterized protein n=1 Tax=marine sediment metagenome TaxID=412755 RepID=A0A0F8W3L3_9ZZZZ